MTDPLVVIPITDENRGAVSEFMYSMYLGEKCPFCGRVFDTVEDLQDAVWCPSTDGRIACQLCWDKATSS